MLDAATYPYLRAVPAPALPIETLVVGKTVVEAADLLPRLFNLCRVAQGIAARAAFGLPLSPEWRTELRREILREHVVKLCLKWPGSLSQPAVGLPRDWAAGGADPRLSLFGNAGELPNTPEEFEHFLQESHGIAPVLRSIRQVFEPFEACRRVLPKPTVGDFFDPDAKENSIAANWADHPVLQCIEIGMGRGPMWSATALAYDLEALLNGALPKAHFGAGQALVPAARGMYGVMAEVARGRVVSFARRTPTDHLLAPEGALDQCLERLPAHRATALGPLLLSILDPCYPVSLRPHHPDEAAHA